MEDIAHIAMVHELCALGFACKARGNEERTISGCYSGDLLSWVMGRAKKDDAWVTIMQNVNVAAVATLADVSCVVLAENVQPDEELVTRAVENNIALFTSELPAYETAIKIYELLKSHG